MEQQLGKYWILTSPAIQEASVLPFQMWNHHKSKLARSMWAAQLAVDSGRGDPGEAVRNPQVQIFHIRSGQFIPDEGTFPDLGFHDGDVFVLLPDSSPRLREYVETTRYQLPGSFPVDLPITEPKPLQKVLQMVEKRQQGGIRITAGRDVNISGVLANSIERARIEIAQTGTKDDIRKAVLELTEAIELVATSEKLSEDEREELAGDIDDLVAQAGTPEAERKSGIVKRALKSVLTFTEQAAAAGMPIVDLVMKVQDAFAR